MKTLFQSESGKLNEPKKIEKEIQEKKKNEPIIKQEFKEIRIDKKESVIESKINEQPSPIKIEVVEKSDSKASLKLEKVDNFEKQMPNDNIKFIVEPMTEVKNIEKAEKIQILNENNTKFTIK